MVLFYDLIGGIKPKPSEVTIFHPADIVVPDGEQVVLGL